MIKALIFFIWMILGLLAVFGAMMLIILKTQRVPDGILWALIPSLVFVGVLYWAARFLEFGS